MEFARVDSTAMEKSILNYTNSVYSWALYGAVFVEGQQGSGWCKVLTNYYTWKRDDYRVEATPCSRTYYGFCEFKVPGGRLRD
jgi:hypothetical protein